jgi:hypothetical protein
MEDSARIKFSGMVSRTGDLEGPNSGVSPGELNTG